MSGIGVSNDTFGQGFRDGTNLITPVYPYMAEYMRGYPLGAQMAHTKALLTMVTSMATITTMMEHMGTYQTAPPGSFVVHT